MIAMAEECRFCGRWCDPEEPQQWSEVCSACDQLREDLKVKHPHLKQSQIHALLKVELRTLGKLEDLEWLLGHDVKAAEELARRLRFKNPDGLSRSLDRRGRTDLEARISWTAPMYWENGRVRQVA